MTRVDAVGHKEDEDIEYGEPSTSRGEDVPVQVLDVPRIPEACKSRDCNHIWRHIVRNIGLNSIEKILGETMSEGFIIDGLLPPAEGAFFGGIEEEFEPALGGDVLDGRGE